MKFPKPVLTLESEDQVSGTTIFDNGTKAFWSEGPGVNINVIYADGTHDVEFENGRHAKALENGIGGAHRKMNLLEEHEHRMMRNYGETVARI